MRHDTYAVDICVYIGYSTALVPTRSKRTDSEVRASIRADQSKRDLASAWRLTPKFVQRIMAHDPPTTKPISYVPPQIFTQAETDFFVHFAVHLNVDRLSRTKSKFYEAIASHPQSQRSSLGWKRHYEQNKDALEQRIKTAYEQHHGEPEPKLNNGVRTDLFTLDEDQLLVKWLGDRPAGASVEQALRELATDPKSGTRKLASWKSHYREHKTTFQSLVANYRRDGAGELPKEPVSYRNKVPASVALRAAAAQAQGRQSEQSSRGSSDNAEGPTVDADSVARQPAPPAQAPVAVDILARPPVVASSRTEYQAIMQAASNVQTPQTPNVSFPNPPAVRIQLPSQSTSQLAVVNRDRTRSPSSEAPSSRSLRPRNRNPQPGEEGSETAKAENETRRRSTLARSKRRLRTKSKDDSDSDYEESHRSDSEESDSASDSIPEPRRKRRRVVSSESPAHYSLHAQAAVPHASASPDNPTATAGWYSNWQWWTRMHHATYQQLPVLRPPAGAAAVTVAEPVPVIAPNVSFATPLPLEARRETEVVPAESALASALPTDEMPSASPGSLDVGFEPELENAPTEDPRNTTPPAQPEETAFDLETFLFGDDGESPMELPREMEVEVDALRMRHKPVARVSRQNALPLPVFFAPQIQCARLRAQSSADASSASRPQAVTVEHREATQGATGSR
ncbi:hypothetical protein HMN09_00317300 [Mycena chlorophos]|uniref:Rap1 Myb domain-containing protein n=1 Tax=Mycena chlorophos TaxID=658473 RepID=A0A8H6TJ19_MYCCL|nr:hypothetical protein HMN09_00317300 [Mycena chlorophos]